MKRLFAIAAIAATLSGCGTYIKQANQAQLDSVGPQPTMAVIDQQSKSYFGRSFVDPESAKYKYGEPFRAYFNEWTLHNSGNAVQTGWAVVIQVNGKKNYGAYFPAYTGDQCYIAVFTKQEIQHVTTCAYAKAHPFLITNVNWLVEEN